MSDKLRIAMVGAGGRAMQAIYPAVAVQPDVEIVGIADIDGARCNAAAGKYGVQHRYFTKGVFEYQEMLSELKPDAVAVIGQPHLMYDIWMWALEHGFNLLIEKPMALSLHQARMLLDAARRNHVITQVALQRRYTPMFVHLRDECLKRGPMTHAVCRFYKSDASPMRGARDHMMDDTVHSIDTLRWVCGGEVVGVESVCRRIGVPDINYVSATLHFDNGSLGYLFNSWTTGKRIFEVEMHAPGIYALAEHEVGAKLYVAGDVNGVAFDARQEAGSDEYCVHTGVAAMAREFFDGIRTGKQPQTSFESSIETMKVAETILAQALLAGV